MTQATVPLEASGYSNLLLLFEPDPGTTKFSIKSFAANIRRPNSVCVTDLARR